MFPLNYLRFMWSPVKIFEKKHEFNWLKSTCIMLFWSVFMLIPLGVNFTPNNDISEQVAFENSPAMFPAETSHIIAEQPFENGQFSAESDPILLSNDTSIVAFLPVADDLEALLAADKYILILLPDSFSLRTPQGDAYGAGYSPDFSEQLDSNETMIMSLLASYQHTQIGMQRTMYIMSRHLVFMIFGIGGLMIVTANIYRLRRQYFWDIYNFEASLAMVVLAMGVPSLGATLAGFIYGHNLLLLFIMLAGTLGMLYLSYKRTHFKIDRSQ